MGFWKEIGKALNSTVKTGNIVPLNELLDAFQKKTFSGSVPIVKHIQRGTGTVAYNADSATVTLNGFTNLEKMSVKVYGGRTNTTGDMDSVDTTYHPVYVGAVSETSLRIDCKGKDSVSSKAESAYFSYEVKEYW